MSTFVFAGKLREATEFCRANSLKDLVFIKRVCDVEVLPKGASVYMIGTWFSNPSCKDIVAALEAKEAVIQGDIGKVEDAF